ncbi:MAG TPA: hypothetical protein PLV68_00785, partial [Ilumatobacteraceae bacterium]|nr:hypothetical protein [Ilumatobacteraceae bacterium]
MSLDPYRLPRTVVPRHYAVTLEPELAEARFTGTVSISVEVTEAVGQIVLNAIELDVSAVRVDGHDAPFHLDVVRERLFITFAHGAGPATIDISFTGILNDKLRGFYRSTYRDDAGTEQVIATTQMQATDCRRAFPCFDEPALKAVFSVTLV